MSEENDEMGTVIGRNTRITVAVALGLFTLSIGAVTSYMNFQAAVKKEIRDSSLETVVEITRMTVKVDELGKNVQGLADSIKGTEARSEARYDALEERIRRLEQSR